jgi:hypothetical protein
VQDRNWTNAGKGKAAAPDRENPAQRWQDVADTIYRVVALKAAPFRACPEIESQHLIQLEVIAYNDYSKFLHEKQLYQISHTASNSVRTLSLGAVTDLSCKTYPRHK